MYERYIRRQRRGELRITSVPWQCECKVKVAKQPCIPPTLLLGRRGGLFADLFEVLLDVGLQGDWDFVAADLSAALAVLGGALRVGGVELLAGALHFHRGFARDVGGTLAETFADLSHGVLV